MASEPILLCCAAAQLGLDPGTGSLVSLRELASDATELLASEALSLPAWALQYLDSDGLYERVDSSRARTLTCERGEGHAKFVYHDVAGLGVDVSVQVMTDPLGDGFCWKAKVANRGRTRIVDLQMPMVVLAPDPTAKVVWPAGLGGRLLHGRALAELPEDAARLWRLCPENGDSQHYPGGSYAQFLAWYSDAVGVLLACDDAEGHVKLLQPVRTSCGVRLGVAHVGDWPDEGERELEYAVRLRLFRGDWYDVADLYREWTLKQWWATPLARRDDVPNWLLDSPPHITVRLQGVLDDGPTDPVEEFLPYERCIPLLERIADRVQSPLVVVLMSWERGGPWVYPDCFPPVGGEGSLARFVGLARERGWQVGSFCNGTRWVLSHRCNGYDGQVYYREHDGEAGVCRTPRGKPWEENWDANWRPSYACCMAADGTRRLATEFVSRLAGWGMRSLQFFDQNINAATFPCFSADHGHPPMPGRWMARAMEAMVSEFRRATYDAGAADAIQSTENGCNETCLPLFQQCDVRVSPPSSGADDYIPLYQYLFHECIVMHGMMSTGPEPYSMPVRTAWNFVWGEIPGGVMTGDGTLLNRETFNWAPWEPQVGSDEHALEMLRVTTAIRRGPGRDFLVYGRMLRPPAMLCDDVEWESYGRPRRVPTVAHAMWQTLDGAPGLAMANWTDREQSVTVCDSRLEGRLAAHVEGRGHTERPVADESGAWSLVLPPLSATVVRRV